MEDHYSSVPVERFRSFFPKFKSSFHGDQTLEQETREKLKDIPQREDQSCYEAFCNVFNTVMIKTNLPHVMKNTSTSRQKRDDSLAAPDLCLYPTDDDAKKAYMVVREDNSAKGNKSKDDPAGSHTLGSRTDSMDHTTKERAAGLENKALTAWAWIVLFIEVKMDSNWEPFEDGEKGRLKLRDTKGGEDTRAQTISYAMRIQRYQHRRFLYSVSVQGTRARFLRWDRNGVIVSREFDYTCSPEILLDFVYNVAAATPSDQGYDTSVTRLTLGQAEELHATVNRDYQPVCGFSPDANASLKKAADEIFADMVLHPVHELRCDGVEPGTSHRYYIGKYRAASWSPVGRGTRVYVAYDPDLKDIAMLKDYWCAIGLPDSVPPELEVLKDFLRAQIKHVPTVIAGGLVHGATTLSQEFIETDTGISHATRQKMRFAVKEVGRSLDTYENPRELVDAVYTALKGHRGAYKMENGVLHRDVSYANIMIDVATGKGFMNDWDMCKRVAALNNGPTQHSRSGTWRYMAAMLQNYPRMYNVLPHDLESFVYALAVPVLQFQQHDLSPDPDSNSKVSPKLAMHFSLTFEVAEQVDGYMYARGLKMSQVRLGQPEWRLIARNSPLDTLIKNLYLLLQAQWNSFCEEQDAIEAHWGVPINLHPKKYPIPDLMGSRPMSTHDEMVKIFEAALAPTAEWNDDRLKKTSDQFVGLFEDRPALPE